MDTCKRNEGFSLVELMITVVIIAVLASLAYPSYQQYVVRANKAAAQEYVLEVSSLQHQFMMDNRGYTSDLTTLGSAPIARVSDNYTITIVNVLNTASPPTFTVQAVPVVGSAQAGSDTLTVNHLNQKNAAWYD